MKIIILKIYLENEQKKWLNGYVLKGGSLYVCVPDVVDESAHAAVSRKCRLFVLDAVPTLFG